MKRLAVAIVGLSLLSTLALIAGGCNDKQRQSAQNPTPYDPAVDAPASPRLSSGQDLLKPVPKAPAAPAPVAKSDEQSTLAADGQTPVAEEGTKPKRKKRKPAAAPAADQVKTDEATPIEKASDAEGAVPEKADAEKSAAENKPAQDAQPADKPKSPTQAPSPEDVESAKNVITQGQQMILADRLEETRQFVADDYLPYVDATIATLKKEKACKEAMEEKGIAVPAAVAAVSIVRQQLRKSAQKDVGTMTFRKVGDDMIAVSTPGESLDSYFVKTADGWKQTVQPELKPVMPAMLEVNAAQDRLLDEMLAGVQDGTITADNAATKADELQQKHVSPAFTKVITAVTAALAPAGESPESVTSPDAEEPKAE